MKWLFVTFYAFHIKFEANISFLYIFTARVDALCIVKIAKVYIFMLLLKVTPKIKKTVLAES
jgi:hypothetical protein